MSAVVALPSGSTTTERPWCDPLVRRLAWLASAAEVAHAAIDRWLTRARRAALLDDLRHHLRLMGVSEARCEREIARRRGASMRELLAEVATAREMFAAGVTITGGAPAKAVAR